MRLLRYGASMKQLLLPFVLVGAVACSGAPLAPKVADAIEVAECQLDAVKALVPHVETAEAVVAAARVQDFDRATALLLQLGMSVEQVKAVADAFVACLPDAGAPEPEPVQVIGA